LDSLEKIRKLLKERNWSVYKLSKESGIPQSTLSNLFTRNNSPSISTLEDICKGFGITIAQFFSDSNVPLDLTPEQAHLLEHWNSLTDEQKKALIALIKSM